MRTLLIVAFVVVGCGSDSGSSSEACAPAGTYVATFARRGGDCPMLEQPPSQALELGAGEACGNYTTELAWVTTEGCAAAVTLTLRADGAGLSEGAAAVRVDCTELGAGACTADYLVSFGR